MYNSQILEELRKQKKLTQSELAKIFCTTQKSISNWEIGRNEPPYEMLIRYATYFEVSTDYILGLTREEKPSWSIKNQVNITGDNNTNTITMK